jgi:hypothetical protein
MWELRPPLKKRERERERNEGDARGSTGTLAVSCSEQAALKEEAVVVDRE